jgi:hypothetical protein
MKIRIRVDPIDQLIGRGPCSIGDAVPEPLGFIAFAPEWLFYTEDTCTEDTARRDATGAPMRGPEWGGPTCRPTLKIPSSMSLLPGKNDSASRAHRSLL